MNLPKSWVSRTVRRCGLAGLLLVGSFAPAAQPAWSAGQAPLLTRWAADVDPANPLPEYPRPQLVRADWLSLNGL